MQNGRQSQRRGCDEVNVDMLSLRDTQEVFSQAQYRSWKHQLIHRNKIVQATHPFTQNYLLLCQAEYTAAHKAEKNICPHELYSRKGYNL